MTTDPKPLPALPGDDSNLLHPPPGLAARLLKRAREAEQERDALAEFKAFVHHRLDQAGVPTHIDGPHSKEGCRVGDRLDWIISRAQPTAAPTALDASEDVRALRSAITYALSQLDTLYGYLAAADIGEAQERTLELKDSLEAALSAPQPTDGREDSGDLEDDWVLRDELHAERIKVARLSGGVQHLAEKWRAKALNGWDGGDYRPERELLKACIRELEALASPHREDAPQPQHPATSAGEAVTEAMVNAFTRGFLEFNNAVGMGTDYPASVRAGLAAALAAARPGGERDIVWITGMRMPIERRADGWHIAGPSLDMLAPPWEPAAPTADALRSPARELLASLDAAKADTSCCDEQANSGRVEAAMERLRKALDGDSE